MNAHTSHQLAQFDATHKPVTSVASHSVSASMMALQVGKLRDKAAKGRQVHLLCATLALILAGVK